MEKTGKWKLADPSWVGKEGVYQGLSNENIRITGISEDRRYVWCFDQIYPSFLIKLTDESESSPPPSQG